MKTSTFYSSVMILSLLSANTLVATAGVVTQQPLQVREVRYEQPSFTLLAPNGGPRGVWIPGPLRSTEYEYKDGVYKSRINGIKIAIPRIGSERSVGIREGVILKPNGTISRTSLIIDVGEPKASVIGQVEGVSAIVVAHLDSLPGSTRESLLDSVHGGPEVRANSTQNNFAVYSNVQTIFGPALQMVLRNRANTQVHFPFQVMGASPADGSAGNYGVTRFIAFGTDTLVQFSQIFPCKGLPDADCKIAALQSLDAFIVGVIEFPISSPKNGTAIN